MLQPNQTERFAVTFVVTQPGRQCHRLDVTADGGHAAGSRACITGTAPVVTPAQLSVRVNGPATARAGENALYAVEVKNNGSSPAVNVVLTVTWGINLQLLEASRGHEDNIPRLTTQWRIAQLAGGETITRQLNCQCLNADEQGAVVRAMVSSQQTAAVANQTATAILPGALAPPRGATPPQSAAPIGPPTPTGTAGSLRVTASALANPIMVGGTTTYVINIVNDRNVPDQDVALSVQAMDDGLTIRVAGTVAHARPERQPQRDRFCAPPRDAARGAAGHAVPDRGPRLAAGPASAQNHGR